MLRGATALACAVGVVSSAIAYRSEGKLEEALVLSSQGRTEEALDAVTDARLLNPDTRADIGEARLRAVLGQPTDDIMRRLAREEPENVAVWLTWKDLQVEAGEFDAARRSYARALELDSQLPPLR